ncbi:hypothetical protein RvY_11640 [Ramazzottius varieornatus]|uniref:Calcipressin n=1 Tax=Ramazzottius varieornatus TaxID=947166 RepID=A0A1D1VM64_RAMVA|nr:hypothetical protein RvY_11640 [Ramazzottius varieornatus]
MDADVDMDYNPDFSRPSRKRDLRKLNSAGSTDSEDISEASSGGSPYHQHVDPPEQTSQILVTNMDPEIFTDQNMMQSFESLIRQFDPSPKIFYFRSFARARVDMESVYHAVQARQQLNGFLFGSRTLKCFIFKDLFLGRRNSGHLELPPLEKQFLISPPASPPVGWEPVLEDGPVIDYDLLAALAGLQPGESHELHPGVRDKNIPAIILQPCIDAGDLDMRRMSLSDMSDGSSTENHPPSYRREAKPSFEAVKTRRPPTS